MPHVLPFLLFETSSRSGLTKVQKEFLNRWVKGRWSYDPETGLVNVRGNFTCHDYGLTSIRGLSFGYISGNVDLTDTKITSLTGFPHTVGGDFLIMRNQISSLEGGPKQVGGDFDCSENKLNSLKGAPEKVDIDFVCSDNSLSSLEGAPYEIGGYFRYDSLLINSANWNERGWLKILASQSETPQEKSLVVTLLSPEVLADFFKSNPMELDLLDDHPDLKQQILSLTGLPDISGLAKSYKSGLL